MKGLHGAIAALVTVTSFMLPALQVLARPVEPDYPCYVQTTTGRIIDLTPSMCGASTLTQSAVPVATTFVAPTSQDSAFMKEYKRRAALEANRGVAKMLVQEATENPGLVSTKGSAVCRDWSSKASEEQIKTKTEASLPTDQKDALKHAAGMTQVQLFIDFAKENFCPNSSDYSSVGRSTGSGTGSGNCNTPDQIAADGKRCGKRAASERPGGR